MQQLYSRPFAEVVAGIWNERKSTLTRPAAGRDSKAEMLLILAPLFLNELNISLHFILDIFSKIDAKRSYLSVRLNL